MDMDLLVNKKKQKCKSCYSVITILNCNVVFFLVVSVTGVDVKSGQFLLCLFFYGKHLAVSGRMIQFRIQTGNADALKRQYQ